MSIARVEEVSAVLVDEDEEERKKQERLNKELQKALKQKEMDVPVADVGRGLWCSRRVKIASSVGCFVALVAAVLGVLFGVVFKPKPPPPSEGLIELFSSMSFDGGEALRSTSTPQNKAYNWLANNNTNLGSYSDERKIQRYVLATLNWDDNNNWLTDNDECGWYNDADAFCSNRTVKDFALFSNNLVGKIPVEVALLSNSVRAIAV